MTLYHYLLFVFAEDNLAEDNLAEGNLLAWLSVLYNLKLFSVNVVIADASGSQEYVQMSVRYHIKE